jgi:hypothetical protein
MNMEHCMMDNDHRKKVRIATGKMSARCGDAE